MIHVSSQPKISRRGRKSVRTGGIGPFSACELQPRTSVGPTLCQIKGHDVKEIFTKSSFRIARTMREQSRGVQEIGMASAVLCAAT